MLAKIKLALRISGTDYDAELTELINAALLDLGVAGILPEVLTTSGADALVTEAVITYCKMNFGLIDSSDEARLKQRYDEQKAQMATCTGYTHWLGE